jgi:putative endonuclease
MFYVYIIKSQKDNSLYIGSTNDLKRRFTEHQNGESKYTKNKIPFELIYYEAFKSKTDALGRERNLKKFKKTYGELKKRIGNSL